MTSRISLIIAKATAITDSIDRMGDANKGKQATGSVGKDYNTLRQQALIEKVELDNLLPPAVSVKAYRDFTEKTDESYAEIHNYCNQIIYLLKA